MCKFRPGAAFAAAVVVLGLLSSRVWATEGEEKKSLRAVGDSEINRATLRGLQGLHVAVSLGPSEEKDQFKGKLTVEDFVTDTELKLRLAGIKVVSEEECSETPECALLFVNVNVLEGTGVKPYFWVIDLELCQKASLARARAIRAPTTTWNVGSFGRAANLIIIRRLVKGKVDQFINAYLSVNPKH